jgi:hypothetical protein
LIQAQDEDGLRSKQALYFSAVSQGVAVFARQGSCSGRDWQLLNSFKLERQFLVRKSVTFCAVQLKNLFL